jgi:hypothetical protein
MNMQDFFNAKELAAYYTAVKEARGNLFGASLFPIVRSTDMSLTWVKGYRARNVVLAPAALDTHAVIRSQQPAEKITTEMPFFKEAMRFNEEQRRNIINHISRFGEKIAEDLMVPIYKQYGELADGAMVQAERMRMALLSVGAFVIQSNADSGHDVRYAFNYDPEEEWKENNTLLITGTSQWTSGNAATSDPINDILNAIATHAERNGAVTARLLMNSSTLRGIMYSEKITRYLQPLGGMVTRRQIIELLESESSAKLELYDKSFVDEQGTSRKFYPDGYVALLPDEAVGQTVCGTTPTEFDLLGQETISPNLAITPEGIAIQTVIKEDPVNIETIVSACVMPSFEGMSGVYVLKGW